jgi:tartrate dehydratase beta subunit/fumarate hydratase class I family protein
MWIIEVKDFPAVVTMDSHGNSLHAQIEQQSRATLEKLLTQP